MRFRRARVAAASVVIVIGTALAAVAAPAAIITGDETQEACRRVDPIVSPGEVSAHGHQFFGVRGVTADTDTSAELRALPEVWDTTLNRTAVWIPCVYEDGRLLRQFSQHGILVYYQPISGTECNAPEDMGGVTHEYGYRGQTGGGSFSQTPPAMSQDGSLVVMLQFRGGRDFGVACFPNARVFIRLNVGAGPIGEITLGGAGGAVLPATGMHGDYLWAHDRAAFQRFLNECLIPGVACGRNPAYL